MHTTWRAPVAWLLCFSARFVVLDTLLSSSLTPTTASPLHLRLSTPSPTRSFPPPYIYIHISSISLSLSLVESFSLLPLEVLRSSVALALSLFSLRLSLSLSRYSKYSSYLFSSRLGCPLGGKERAEKYALFAGLSIVLSLVPRRPATRSRSLEETRTLLSLPLSFGL